MDKTIPADKFGYDFMDLNTATLHVDIHLGIILHRSFFLFKKNLTNEIFWDIVVQIAGEKTNHICIGLTLGVTIRKHAISADQ